MEKITLVELHLEEVSFTATASGLPFGDDESDGGPDADDESGAAAGRGRRLLLVFVVLLVLVAVARALAGDDELDDLHELDDLEG